MKKVFKSYRAFFMATRVVCRAALNCKTAVSTGVGGLLFFSIF